MKKNMGTVDRGIRLVLAIVVGVLYFNGQISGVAAIVLGIIALIFVLTSLMGFCPLYTLIGIKTVKEDK